MTWGEPISFGRKVGKVTTIEFRLAIVKNGEKPGMCLVIPGEQARALRWTNETAVALLPGQGEHRGWLRLVVSKDPGARRLRATGKSKNLRLVTPLWPWLEGVTEYRPLEVVESVMHVNMVDVRLPEWAAPRSTPDSRRPDGDFAPPRSPPAPPAARARRLLEDVPHPTPPYLPARRGEPRANSAESDA